LVLVWPNPPGRGGAPHGSKPELGLDANVRMARLLARLSTLIDELAARPPHPLVGPPSMHVARLEGGSGLSTYAAECVAALERRTIPGETAEQVLQEIETVMEEARRADPSLRVTLEHLLTREPFETSPDGPLARAVLTALETARGRPAAVVGDTPWMDAAILAAHGVETVVCGPAGTGAHAAEEWVDLDSVERLAATLAGAAREYCRET
jgi:acetylornithine deacetylase